MTVLEQMVGIVSEGENSWAQFVSYAEPSVTGNPSAWGRQGGSWGKEGEFFKK